jgi:nucleoside-diphosphate-sugar epimerase
MAQCIAITGATGFIGGTLCRLLQDSGRSVRALVRTPARAGHLQSWIDECVEGSLADASALRRLLVGADAVVHCAGSVRGADQRAFDRVNVDGVRNLLDAARAAAIAPRLLCLSSLAAREPQLSWYAASKRRGEQVLERQGGALSWVALRPPAVYGPGDTELLPLFRFMSKGFAPIPGSPEARFSMIFVEDLGRAMLAWLDSDNMPNGIYSLHDGCQGGYSWRDVCAAVAALCGRSVHPLPVPGALLSIPAWTNLRLARWLGYAPMLTPAKLRELRHRDWVCSNDPLQSVLNWRPEVRLEEGLRRTPGWCARIDNAA